MNYGGQPRIDIARDKFKSLQDAFSAAAHVYICCLLADGSEFTSLSGKRDEMENIRPFFKDVRCRMVIERLEASDVEEQTEIDTDDPSVRMACIKLANDNVTHLYLLTAGVINGDDRMQFVTDADSFTQCVDAMREFAIHMVGEHYLTAEKSVSLRRSEEAAQKLKTALDQSNAMTEIVQLLESDDDLRTVVNGIFKQAMNAVDFSHAFLINTDGHGKAFVAGIAQAIGERPLFGGALSIDEPEFIKSVSKITVVSASSDISDTLRNEFRHYGIEAAVVIPIRIDKKAVWFVGFTECRKTRQWDIDEVKYLNDVAKIIHDVVLKNLQKDSIEKSASALEALLNNVDCGICVCSMDNDTDPENSILFANSIFKSDFERELSSGDRMMAVKMLSDCIHSSSEFRHESDGKWYVVTDGKLKWTDGRDVCIYTVYDITEKKLYQDRIEQQAKCDFLTGLYNRMCAEKDLACFIAGCAEKGTKGALLYLDLDDFKHINDGLGHRYGDVLLKAIAHSFQRVKGIEHTCYRMGGDEFIIIVPDSEYVNLERIVSDIKDIFMKPWFLRGADYYCTMSIGLVTFPEEGDSVQELIKKADIAMYQAKHLGKNRISKFERESDSRAVMRLDMEKNMRLATSRNSDFSEFEVYYQPLVDVSEEGDPCCGAEALVRWNSKELGFISPGDFIPLAEYLGLITSIGEYVLRKACFECRKWNENGYPKYKVNVNLSVIQLLQNDIVERISDVICETEIDPSNLTLEVTESLAINDMEKMKEVLSQIRRLGCRIALDDFGTGYSSLNHIREIPFDVIKVDQSFVRDLATNHYSQSFVKMVNELAEAIGVRVCVEGIETQAQYDIVKKIHANMIQGYYFDRPMPAGAFEAKYTEQQDNIKAAGGSK